MLKRISILEDGWVKEYVLIEEKNTREYSYYKQISNTEEFEMELMEREIESTLLHELEDFYNHIVTNIERCAKREQLEILTKEGI